MSGVARLWVMHLKKIKQKVETRTFFVGVCNSAQLLVFKNLEHRFPAVSFKLQRKEPLIARVNGRGLLSAFCANRVVGTGGL